MVDLSSGGGGGAYFQQGLLLEGILHFKMGWA